MASRLIPARAGESMGLRIGTSRWGCGGDRKAAEEKAKHRQLQSR
jgi:hypothetical protein